MERIQSFLKYYKVRKLVAVGILIGSIVSIILVVIQRDIFMKFANDEKLFKTPDDGDLTSVRLTGEAQKSLYNIFFAIELVIIVMILSLSSIITYGLFTNKWNGRRQFKYIIIFTLLLMVFLIIHISLKPLESEKQVGQDNLGVPIFEKLDGPKYSSNYNVLWFTIAAFSFSIYALKKFGCLKNDITLKNTTNQKVGINV